MKAIETKLKGCYILQPRVFEDERGFFFESFNTFQFKKLTNIDVNFVQDNQSFSSYGVLRGLHAQEGEFAQAKLVRVLQGEVLDVVVDIRPNSKTFGEHFSVRLSAENKQQLFIPRGFLHGFVVLSETATFFYKCDNYYNKNAEIGVIYKDVALEVDWLLPHSELIISEKDLVLPQLKDLLIK